MESVRQDHTSVGGYDSDTTPNIANIAAKSRATSFSHCFSHSLWTPPCSASILTGTYMSSHGLGMDGSAGEKIPAGLDTLPELLSEEGYATACLSPSPYISEATGLDRGFDRFTRLSAKRLLNAADPMSLIKYALGVRSDGPGFTLNYRRHNLSFIMTEMAKKWITELSRQNPSFLYLHMPNPHHPYTPCNRWIEEYTDEISMASEEAMDLVMDVFDSTESLNEHIANGCEFSSDEWDGIKAMYDAEIRDADRYVGELFDHVTELDRDTIFVVTGDHGEFFGELGLLGHNLALHDAVTNVPLVLYGIPDLHAGSDDLVQHIDVTRTIGEYVGCATNQFQGADLTEESRDYCLMQRGTADLGSYTEYNTEFDTSRFFESTINCLRSHQFKYFEGGEKRLLFELPDEEHPVREPNPQTEREMATELESLLANLPDRSGGAKDSEFTEEMKERLSDLGYI
ncbi:sulfatase [Halobacterium sp. GSL-19]|nr:sulfatase [Halobacterium sp. GSL-19]